MKYTIELTENQKKQMDLLCELAHRYIGFNPKLEPIKIRTTNVEDTGEYQIGYKVGFEDGKKQAIEEIPELANKENEIYNNGYNKGVADFENLFVHEHDYEQFFEDTYGSKEPDYNLYDLVARYGAKKVLNDFKKWQEKESEEVKVGDEVIITGLKDIEKMGVVTMLANNNYAVICLINGSEMARVTKYQVKPTGKHYEDIEQLLSKLQAS